MTTTQAPADVVQLATRLLASREPASDGAAICEALAAHLTPILGHLGVLAIYERGLRLAARDFTWLAQALPAGADRSPWERLRASLQDQDPALARQAAARLLAEILSLYVGLIGSALLGRLLSELWPEVSLIDRSKE